MGDETGTIVDRLRHMAREYEARSLHPVGPGWSLATVQDDARRAADLRFVVDLVERLLAKNAPGLEGRIPTRARGPGVDND